MSSFTPRVARGERALNIARLVPALGQPESRNDAAQRVCDAARSLLGATASAVLLGEHAPVRVALSGFALQPPEGLPSSLEPEGLAELGAWSMRVGLGPIEVAPLAAGSHALGVLILFGGHVEPLSEGELRLLGSVAGYLIEHSRTVEDLRRAYESQERSQDQVVRTERLRVLGEMALGIAHDFNNVLNAVLGQVGVLELLAAGGGTHRDGATGDRPDGSGAAQATLASLDRPLARLKEVALDGAGTVRRLQDFSRQRRDQEFVDVDISDLLHSAVANLRQRASRLVIDEAIEPRLGVAGNADELRDALCAVFDNAVEAGARRLTVAVERHDDETLVVIEDDGCGMSREVRKRAFDPFFTTKGSGVSGLGLSVAYGIVRRHGGRIDLDSQPGHGTRVRMRMPGTRCDTTGPLPLAPVAVVAGSGGARILLVEDDPDNREAMATLLGLGGHTVTAAHSGHDGLRQFSPTEFDLVLTDLGLPDMTGWEVARQVKDVSSSTPVALITGWGLNLAQEEIRRRGVDVLIKKPIEPRSFLAQLAALCRRPMVASSMG